MPTPPARSDAEAEELFHAHLGIAERKATVYARKLRGMVELNELRAFAFVGLLDAARRFVAREEASSFVFYAHTRVRGAIRDGLRSLEWWQRRNTKRDPDFVHVRPRGGLAVYDLLDERTKAADEQLEAGELLARVKLAIRWLPKRERELLERHYFGGVPFDQIAREQGVAPARISQIHKRALVRLRERLAKKKAGKR